MQRKFEIKQIGKIPVNVKKFYYITIIKALKIYVQRWARAFLNRYILIDIIVFRKCFFVSRYLATSGNNRFRLSSKPALIHCPCKKCLKYYKRRVIYKRQKAGLGIRSLAHRSFAHLLNERCEQIAQVAHQK